MPVCQYRVSRLGMIKLSFLPKREYAAAWVCEKCKNFLIMHEKRGYADFLQNITISDGNCPIKGTA